jgi:hypothetical protein
MAELFIFWFSIKKRKIFEVKNKIHYFCGMSLYKTTLWKYFTEIIYLVLDGIANKNLS